MEQEEFVPDYAQTSREIWIQQTYEEIGFVGFLIVGS